jgi:hypothetical protein
MNEQQIKKSTKLAKIEGHEFVRRILYGDYIRRGFTDVVLDRILALEAAEVRSAILEEALKDAVGYVYNLYGGNMALADMDTEKWRAALASHNLESTP